MEQESAPLFQQHPSNAPLALCQTQLVKIVRKGLRTVSVQVTESACVCMPALALKYSCSHSTMHAHKSDTTVTCSPGPSACLHLH
eukprot:1146134-Pelagomonas_calceolata.AAC.1